MIESRNLSLFDGVNQQEDSSNPILQNVFVQLERMTSPEASLSINYSFSESLFGKILIASSSIGVCYMAFYEDQSKAIEQFKVRFPNATIVEQYDEWHRKAKAIFKEEKQDLEMIHLHLQGTEFQFQVWNELLKIPLGELSTYGEIARKIGKPKASRAVGTAIGSNPVAYIVPCHRVVQKSGKIGGYMWGVPRKRNIISWESGKVIQ